MFTKTFRTFLATAAEIRYVSSSIGLASTFANFSIPHAFDNTIEVGAKNIPCDQAMQMFDLSNGYGGVVAPG